MKKYLLIPFILLNAVQFTFAQDTLKQQPFSFHFQQTIITQYKPAFNAPYSGQNSLSPLTETQSSITTTFLERQGFGKVPKFILTRNYQAVRG